MGGQVTMDAGSGATFPQEQIQVPGRGIDRDTAILALDALARQGHGTQLQPPQTFGMFTPFADAYDGDEAFVQSALIVAGVEPPPGPIDGWFGPETRASLAAFQQAAGLEPTGDMDQATWQALQEVARTGAMPQAEQVAEPGAGPAPGTAAATDAAIGQAMTAWDSAQVHSDSAESYYARQINAPLEDAVAAEYAQLVEGEGLSPADALATLADRYNEGSRSDRLMQGALSRLAQEGRVEDPAAADDAADPEGGQDAAAPASTQGGTVFLAPGQAVPMASGPVAAAV